MKNIINLDQYRFSKLVTKLIGEGKNAHDITEILTHSRHKHYQRISQNVQSPAIRPNTGKDNDCR